MIFISSDFSSLKFCQKICQRKGKTGKNGVRNSRFGVW